MSDEQKLMIQRQDEEQRLSSAEKRSIIQRQEEILERLEG